MQKKFIFFLGGHDAEMLTIRQILVERKIMFHDKNLAWGAALSSYREELNKCPKNKIPVLIELRLDMEYPERSIVIDHHNDRAGKFHLTSIEQTAELLGVKLNRYQQLISANDRGHIPAMRELGAAPEEIHNIRLYDRQCQGVTPEDEAGAEEAIKTRSEELTPEAIYVRSLSEKTSPVMDRLYDKYKHMFIVTPSNDLSYFGPGSMINRLEEVYTQIKAEHPEILSWKGGNLPDYGFFGSTVSIDREYIIRLLHEH